MLRFEEFEYETSLKNKFTPDIKIANLSNLTPKFAEKLQISDEKTQKSEIFNQNPVNYEIKDITPKSLFRRK